MKLLLILACIGVCAAIVWASRQRHQASASQNSTARPSSLFGTGSHAINVRPADNVRLLSDEQISALELEE